LRQNTLNTAVPAFIHQENVVVVTAEIFLRSREKRRPINSFAPYGLDRDEKESTLK
jgi:hypothetical protein